MMERTVYRVTFTTPGGHPDHFPEKERYRDVSASSEEAAIGAVMKAWPDAFRVYIAVAPNQDSFSEMD